MGALSEPGAPPARRRAIVFIGFMGAGKSTAVRDAAAALGVAPRDSDAILEERLGHSVATEFERAGEAAFRAREEELVLALLDESRPGDVLALGGGSVLSERVRAALADHVTVLLDVDAPTAWDRVARSRDGAPRPLARDAESFAALWRERAPLYEGLADAIVPAHSREAIARALPSVRELALVPGVRLLWASASSADYPVYVASGLLDTPLWPLPRERSRGFGVTDEAVAERHGARLAWAAHTVTIAGGERAKTLATAELVWRALAGEGMTRADHVVALGGGVVGDLAGFCAATYQRGVPVVQVPTTLVAQVDSAYGGKTGVDLPGAKNYVGAYHQPAGVMVDPSLLATLPPAELAAGYAEVLKTALIAGGDLWERVASDEPLDERMIIDCARTKLAVVARDERDAQARQLLNLGHTIGHAIEAATGYARYRHGEAVALGLLAALRLSGQDALRELAAELLTAHGLPTRLEGVRAEDVLEATRRDKKRTSEHVPYVVVEAPGRVRTGAVIPPAEQRAAIAELLR